MNSEVTDLPRVIALLDGRPGHEKQTMGIIQALHARIPVQVRRINVKPFSLISSLIQTCRVFLPNSGMTHPDIVGGNLLIGTGSRTHLPMLLYKKKYGMPAVTCMSPPRHLAKRFDICFVPEHDGMREIENIVLTLGAPNCSVNKRKHQEECGLIVLGGVDVKSHHWESRQIVEMVERICRKETQKTWTVSSSPRTPQDTVDMVKALTAKYEHIHFFDYKNTPPGWIEEQYDKNKVVWITADSISMVYEALTAGCCVGIFPMRWARVDSKFERNEDLLLQRKLVTPFSSWAQGKTLIADNRILNEADRCADRIVQLFNHRRQRSGLGS